MTEETTTPRRFENLDLSGAVFREVDLSGVVMRNVWMADVSIEGDLERVRINGVDVVPLIEAELDRRDPERVRMRPTDPDGFRDAWAFLEQRWEETVARTRTLDPDLLHESVDGEWSFVQTLRHLAFATESWVSRAILGDPRPWHPLTLPWDSMTPHPEVPWDRDARPSLDEALAVRRSRQDVVRSVLDGLTPQRLAEDTEPVDGPAWPPVQSFPVRECLLTVLNEEYQHRLFAERDFDALAMRSSRS